MCRIVQPCVSFAPFSMLLMYHGKLVMWGSKWSQEKPLLGHYRFKILKI